MMSKIGIINVYDLTSDMAVEYGIGNALYNLITKSLEANEKVIVDFSGVNVVLSSFLNASIGNLFRSLNRKEYTEKIEVVGLPEFSDKILERVVTNAEKKYSKNC